MWIRNEGSKFWGNESGFQAASSIIFAVNKTERINASLLASSLVLSYLYLSYIVQYLLHRELCRLQLYVFHINHMFIDQSHIGNSSLRVSQGDSDQHSDRRHTKLGRNKH